MSRFLRDKTRTVKKTTSPRKEEYAEYFEWLNKLREGVREGIIKHIETNLDRVEILLDDEAMKIWGAAFSDPSFTSVSYERQETYGDTIINPFVVGLALEQYPYSTPDQLSNFKTYYVSNVYQGNLMKEYTVNGKPFIDTYMLKSSNLTNVTGYRMTTYIYSDFYEALYGAIMQAGRRIKVTTADGVKLLGGLGNEYCERWFNHIFVKNLQGGRLDFAHSKKPSDTILSSLIGKFEYYTTNSKTKFEITDRVERKNPKDPSDTRTVVATTIKWTPGVLNFLKNSNLSGLSKEEIERLPKNTSAILVDRLVRDTKAESRQAACEEALRKLADLGITEERTEEMKRVLDNKAMEEDPQVNESYGKLVRYCKERGYTNIHFGTLQKHANVEGNIVALQLIVDKGEESIVLRSEVFDQGDTHLCKILIIKNFADKI